MALEEPWFDVIQFVELGMGNLGLSHEDVHWSRHPAAHPMDRVLDLEAVFLHLSGRSPTSCCALARGRPYPGAKITGGAYPSRSTTSPALSKVPKRTLDSSDRFLALQFPTTGRAAVSVILAGCRGSNRICAACCMAGSQSWWPTGPQWRASSCPEGGNGSPGEAEGW